MHKITRVQDIKTLGTIIPITTKNYDLYYRIRLNLYKNECHI